MGAERWKVTGNGVGYQKREAPSGPRGTGRAAYLSGEGMRPPQPAQISAPERPSALSAPHTPRSSAIAGAEDAQSRRGPREVGTRRSATP